MREKDSQVVGLIGHVIEGIVTALTEVAHVVVNTHPLRLTQLTGWLGRNECCLVYVGLNGETRKQVYKVGIANGILLKTSPHSIVTTVLPWNSRFE